METNESGTKPNRARRKWGKKEGGEFSCRRVSGGGEEGDGFAMICWGGDGVHSSAGRDSRHGLETACFLSARRSLDGSPSIRHNQLIRSGAGDNTRLHEGFSCRRVYPED